MSHDLPEIGRIAQQFESEWNSGKNPRIADWIAKAPEDAWEELVRNLLRIDIENRLRMELKPSVDDYAALGDRARPLVESSLNQIAEPAEATLDGSAPSSPWRLARGSQIGPYRLLQLIGQGGMGEVWMAEQTTPVKRRVALKLIKKGIDSREVLARFEAERQALALMNHSNIARILDTGSTLDGRPWFSMELVLGRPITDYCDQNRLGIDERLKLFAEVCYGLQHAHQKGIMHRDLKPSNILVTVQDGKALPKIIDFGLAKAMESTQRLTEQSLFTGFGQILGTIKYMSPEQADLDNLDIDTRTDIYSMGVILYELLTGDAPLDDSSLKNQAVMKILHMIREQDAVKPSSKLNSSTQEAVLAITGRRKTDSLTLRRVLLGDLDWIVMKALEKDRTRRYESAYGFALDIQRYLNNEPVVARPPSVGYRVSKFVKKNRASVIAGSLVLLALLVGIAGLTTGLIRAESARKVAVEARAAEKVQRENAELRRQEAEQNLSFAKKGNEILASVFSGLDPNEEFATVAELRNALSNNLENAIQLLEDSAIGDSLAVADMQETLGLSLLGLGEYTQAIKLLEQVQRTRQQILGQLNAKTLTGFYNLALCYDAAGLPDKALPLLEKTLELRRELLGADHPEVLSTMNNLAMSYESVGEIDRALSMLEQNLVLSKSKLGDSHQDTLNSMQNLAMTYKVAGQLDKAVPLMEETLHLLKTNLGPEHSDTVSGMQNLAWIYSAAGQLHSARQLWEEASEMMKEKLGFDHPTTLACMTNLARCYLELDNPDEALAIFRETLQLRKMKLGIDHPSTLLGMRDLAGGLKAAGQLEDALQLYRETLDAMRLKHGPSHSRTLTCMNDLAGCYYATGQLESALQLWEETLASRKSKFEPDHPETLTTMNNLAMGYKQVGRLDKALPLLEEATKLMSDKLGRSHPTSMSSMNNLARTYEAAGLMDKALPLFEETLDLRRVHLGPDHSETLNSMLNLGSAYSAADKGDQASAVLRELIKTQRTRIPSGDPRRIPWLITSSMLLLKCKQFVSAEEMISEALQIRKEAEPDAWTTFNTMSLLGEALLGQQKYNQAEPLLVQGLEGMQARSSSIPPEGATRIPEAIDRLISLYKALENSTKIAQLEAEKKRMLDSDAK